MLECDSQKFYQGLLKDIKYNEKVNTEYKHLFDSMVTSPISNNELPDNMLLISTEYLLRLNVYSACFPFSPLYRTILKHSRNFKEEGALKRNVNNKLHLYTSALLCSPKQFLIISWKRWKPELILRIRLHLFHSPYWVIMAWIYYRGAV